MDISSPPRWLQAGLIPVVLATGASCVLVTDSCACSSVAPFVSFEGTAQDSANALLEGVSVSLTLRDAGCNAVITSATPAVTDSVGAFQLWADGLSEGSHACADFEALRFHPAGVDSVLMSAVPVTFGFAEPTAVDFVFPVRPAS